jgi:hypothetical protein
MTETCEWISDEYGAYISSCGDMFQFNEGDPAYNQFNYCPFCGGFLIEVHLDTN